MGCGSCFGLFYKQDRKEQKAAASIYSRGCSEEHLLGCSFEEIEEASRNGAKHSATASVNRYMASVTENSRSPSAANRNDTHDCEDRQRVNEISSGVIDDYRGRAVPVKESRRAIKGKDSSGRKMINEYVWEDHIGRGSYGKVDLYQSKLDGKFYAIKIFHRARLCKVKVAPSQTAMGDVLQEVSVMRELNHPNVVKLFEVIDDPESDNLYMVLEYAEGRAIFEGSGPLGGIGEVTAQKFLKDMLGGLMYLHNRRIVHGDIKPENLLISSDNRIKISDFSRSWVFEDDDDEIRRSPGTPVFTAPECCSGLPYHGKAADVWALGVTLYCMVFGSFPFIGDTVQSTYEKIVQSPLRVPEGLNPDLAHLLEGLLCKDPVNRMSLDAVYKHAWFMKGSSSFSQ